VIYPAEYRSGATFFRKPRIDEIVMSERMDQFESDLATVVNRYSRENVSNTPDFILAEFMERCLNAFESASKRREDWYGHHLSIGSQDGLTASEAVFGVLAWLTTREEPLTVGCGHECGVIASLAQEFCDANHLRPPRETWADNLIHPSGECSQINK
jgi:hypothetical protein